MNTLIKFKSFYLILAVCLCLIAGILIFENKSGNTNNLETEVQFSTEELIAQHQKETFKTLIEKAIEVSGNLKEINFKNNVYTLYLSDSNHETYILCELQDDQADKIANLKIGENIKVKGVLKGHLLDVILLNCIIIS